MQTSRLSCKGMSDLIKNINHEDTNNSMSTTAEEEPNQDEHTTTTAEEEVQSKTKPQTNSVQDQERTTAMDVTTTATMKVEISNETDSTPAGEETTETER